jgi:hypothetical protein
MTFPPGSWRQITVPETQGSSKTSDIVARFFGLISSIRPMICLLSLGKRRRRRHGPLITSGFLSASGACPVAPFVGVYSAFGVGAFESVTASRAGVSKSVVDFDGASEILLISVPGVGGDAKSLYELSVILGIFHGNRRRDMQQNMIASDQISGGCGSYFRSS